jgi:hypothetical protein
MRHSLRKLIPWVAVCVLVACTAGEIGPEDEGPVAQSGLGACESYRECILWFDQGYEYEYACGCERPDGFNGQDPGTGCWLRLAGACGPSCRQSGGFCSPDGFWTYWSCECPLGAPGPDYVDQGDGCYHYRSDYNGPPCS